MKNTSGQTRAGAAVPKPAEEPEHQPVWTTTTRAAKVRTTTRSPICPTALPAAPAPKQFHRLSPHQATLLGTLNKDQRDAVTSHSPTVAILAGPGSGKTHTLTSRVAWLVDVTGYAPQNVIVATFTVKAAREMKERIGKVLGEARARRLVLGTFHSVARRYLAAYGRHIGLDPNFTIIDDGDAKAILARVIERLNLSLDAVMVRGWISKKKARGCLGEPEAPSLQSRSQFESQSRPPVGPNSKNLEAVYREYQSHLADLNLLDYDDLLVRCADLLRARPHCVANVEAVLIDEYQDTNGVQFELMQLFAQARGCITVVGDPDQSIYGWRSAETTNLARFLDAQPGTAVIALEENYRSSQSILATSLAVIQQDRERYDKSLRPIHKKGALPVLRTLKDMKTEAAWIVAEIRRAIAMTGGLLGHGDVAILVRSAVLSRPIEQALSTNGIPYRMIGGHKFFERAEIRLLMDYLRVIHQPNDNDALARIVNTPKRGIGVDTVKGLLREAECAGISFWTLLTKIGRGVFRSQLNLKEKKEEAIRDFVDMMRGIRRRREDAVDGNRPALAQPLMFTSSSSSSPSSMSKLNLVGLVDTLIEQLHYQNYIRKAYKLDEESRWANVEEFGRLTLEFMKDTEVNEADEELPDVADLERTAETSVLARFLSNVSLASDAAEDKTNTAATEKSLVTISTIHAAKGLEWPVVFIPAAYDGSIPHSRSEDHSEERRLLYVAMTRAKCLLNVSYALRSHMDKGKQSLSAFLAPIAAKCFAEHGPSYNKALLEDLGDILRRAVPSDVDIFKNMPLQLPQEDDTFPLEPEMDNDTDAEDCYDDRDCSGRHHAKPPNKRRKVLDAPDYVGHGARTALESDDSGSWQRGYATTMEGAAANFTMASFSGFTTASAHHTALLAEEAAAAAAAVTHGRTARYKGKHVAPQPAALAAATILPRGQQTIPQSFVRSSSMGGDGGGSGMWSKQGESKKFGGGSTSSSALVRTLSVPATTRPYQPPTGMSVRQQPRAAPPCSLLPNVIPPDLTRRKVGGVLSNRMPAGSRTLAVGSGISGGECRGGLGFSDSLPHKRYAHFSSPPPLVEIPESPSQQKQGKQQQQQPLYRRWTAGGKENQMDGTTTGTTLISDRHTTLPPGRAQPAAVWHAASHAPNTRFPPTGNSGSSRGGSIGWKRPAAGVVAAGSSVAPMDKLRMPFKPPSIHKPS
ncbi:ATP-dependent DNA helicase [Niveomyces insectorum RCEF 264]|uniref:DNA 3'-5' helicase n=1 Tax=Niveomyces insectorum RCEF 264 TaxID=1081102 RepID=A0A167N770_9HYPO|nr:ATP-dependent DNA helicase [Niveomyces insectorum RCEF 264]